MYADENVIKIKHAVLLEVAKAAFMALDFAYLQQQLTYSGV